MKLEFKDSYLGKLRAVWGHKTIIVPGVRIILENKKGEILFIRRSDDGKWALPAGTPELGESLQDTVLRELREEAGLQALRFDCFGVSSNPRKETHTYPNKDRVQSFVFLVYVKSYKGRPQVSDDEALEVKFFSRKHFPKKSEVLAHELESVFDYFKYKKSKKFIWS